MFPIIRHNAISSVNAHDAVEGHQWKTSIHLLGVNYHKKQYLRVINEKGKLDCFHRSCDADTILKGGFQYLDHLSEILISRKLLGSLHFIKDLKHADLVLDPVLEVTSIFKKCCYRGL